MMASWKSFTNQQIRDVSKISKRLEEMETRWQCKKIIIATTTYVLWESYRKEELIGPLEECQIWAQNQSVRQRIGVLSIKSFWKQNNQKSMYKTSLLSTPFPPQLWLIEHSGNLAFTLRRKKNDCLSPKELNMLLGE